MPTLGSLISTVAPAVGSITDWATRRNGLNNGTATVTAGANQAGQRIDTASQQGIDRWQPYADTGADAVTRYRNLIDNPTSFDPESVMKEPGYQFAIDTAFKNTDRINRATGQAGNGGQVRRQQQNLIDVATTRYNDAFNRFMATQQNQQNLIKGGVDIGTNATTAQNTLGVNAAEDRAGLDLAVANSTAANQVQGANNTANTIGKLAGVGQQVLGKVLPAAGPTLGAAASPGLAAAVTAGGPAAATGAAATAIPAGAAALEPGAAAAAASGGGLGSTLTALATNPITIGIAGALAVGAIWLKSQAHWEANTAVKDFENPFAQKTLAPFAAQWDKAIKSGNVTAEQGHQALDQYTQNFQDYIAGIEKWAGNSKDKKKVAEQSIANLYKTTVKPQIDKMSGQLSQLGAA